MTVDMSQFYQVFFEEAAEHLANMEQMLLDIDLDSIDDEEMNAIFRAAHSIKGSAGTFGFQDLAQVTHELETLLDRVRKHEVVMTTAMVDASLEAGDLLRDLVAAHRGEGSADLQRVAEVCATLQRLYGNDAAAEDAQAAPLPERALQKSFSFSFALPPACADAAGVIENMSAELEMLGAKVVDVSMDAAGRLQCVLGGTVDAAAVRDIVEFIAHPGSYAEGAEAPVAAGDDTWGLFADDAAPSPAAEPADESWGLFAPEPATGAASDDSFGLFADPVAPAPVKADESFGFFDQAPGVPDLAQALQASASPDGSYGFFEPLPAASADVTPVPVSQMPAEPAPVAAVKPAEAPRAPAARAAKAGSGGDTSIRVGVDKVDQIINLVGELVITQAMLASAASKLDPVEFERLMNGVQQLERNTRDLQESVMSIRMLPMSTVFSRFPRVVRDLSQKLGKQVRLVTTGESTELDKGLIERIADPLTHLIRNSLDHGIETPDLREARGKPREGTITLKASHQSGNIVIEVGDDGAGLNRDRILSKARERGFAVSDAMSDSEVWALIFEAGFSTAEQITEVSGRGVGMDVVKKNIAAMGGRVDIESMTGVGTRMTVRLPLTLAILDGMSVAVGADTYIVPLNYVVESLQPTAAMIKSVAGQPRLVQVRNEYLNILTLKEALGLHDGTTDLERGILVVLESDGDKIALFVDELVGQHQVVIKSLEANYRKVVGISGATIMGDGHVGLILDVPALVSSARGTFAAAA
ncbi:Chemotaxis protein CheA [Methyloversatilis universalis FAM5]|uniref:Chemotaxis protein CheA n=1 Tax=Methyloversatilis universalis (strain ATCC BAA-1314 / DSM 25237 / JCM 13912 / CCUG 52030 / FAM5) TaxID=1000565 RepID=F5RE90_METUF|nr:chemotaxis protein CheW [Methyloversatilis universalis]EGK71221.1 Chemotaxis protein CheA [Methyloversatilis universalis FAM5]